MKRYILLILLILSCVPVSMQAQKLVFENELAVDFDNKEYAGSEVGTSGTFFRATLDTKLKYYMDENERHSLTAGALIAKDFGSYDKFLDYAMPVINYQYQNVHFGMNAGIFEKSKMPGKYSGAFFGNTYLRTSQLFQGFGFKYLSDTIRFGFCFDWDGMYSASHRESFNFFTSLEGHFCKYFYAGLSGHLRHYANFAKEESDDIVDLMLFNPYLASRFTAFFNFDISLGMLFSPQRARRLVENMGDWELPYGGEFVFKMEKWGAYIVNGTYFGKNLQPYYKIPDFQGNEYGSGLYFGDPFYGTTGGFYNYTVFGYQRDFLKNRLSVKAEVLLQAIKGGVYNREIITLIGRIDPTLWKKKKTSD